MSYVTHTVRRAGIMDVAERAGVSRQTVTRAMNDMSGISATTKQRVLDAARELRYRPSRFGRGLVTNRIETLGLVVVDLKNGFWSELASGVLDEAVKHGWSVVVAEASHDPRLAVSQLLEQVDALFGLIDLPGVLLDEIVGSAPVVLLDPDLSDTDRVGIALSFDDPMTHAVAHLLARGAHEDRHARLVTHARGLGPSRELCARGCGRGSGAGRGDQRRSERACDRRRTRVVDDLLNREPAVDALVCFNDYVALGAMKSLHERGIRIPDDLSVVGVDGSAIGLVVTPELSTLRFDFAELARVAFSMVAGMIDGTVPERGADAVQRLSPQLVIRGSS